jgi:peroxisomal membrane protein 4
MSERYRWPDHHPLEPDWILSAVRGLRNAIITGCQIRLPYVLQALVFLLIYRTHADANKFKFTLKQALTHGRDLGLFVLIYKSICSILRHYGINNGVESWIAGLIGGYIGFGDSTGVRGSVNFQIVLYLLSRGLVGLLKGQVARGNLPPACDISKGTSFRCLAAFALALILYLTEHQPETLQPSFMSTMTFLYHHADSGPLLPPRRFLIPCIIVFVAVFWSLFSPRFELENLTAPLDKLELPAGFYLPSSTQPAASRPALPLSLSTGTAMAIDLADK